MIKSNTAIVKIWQIKFFYILTKENEMFLLNSLIIGNSCNLVFPYFRLSLYDVGTSSGFLTLWDIVGSGEGRGWSVK